MSANPKGTEHRRWEEQHQRHKAAKRDEVRPQHGEPTKEGGGVDAPT